MSVYVDDMRAPYGRMVMCHMIADSTEELLAMADAIGVQRKWIQGAGTSREHFDIALDARAKAVRAGAIEIGLRDLAMMTYARKNPNTVLALPAPSGPVPNEKAGLPR